MNWDRGLRNSGDTLEWRSLKQNATWKIIVSGLKDADVGDKSELNRAPFGTPYLFRRRIRHPVGG